MKYLDVTLPALQKNFVNILFVVAWEFCIERWWGFLVIFSGLRLPRNEARKVLEKFKIRSKIRWGFPNPKVSHFFRERSRLCRGPFRDCSSLVLLIGRERGKGQIGKIPGPSPSKSGKSQKNREGPKRTKKEGQVQIGKHPRF